MPSRAEISSRVENVLRGLSFAALGLLIWLAFDRGRSETVVTARSANIESALADWSRMGISPDRIAVRLDSNPTPRQRDWLAALRGAGSQVSWSGSLSPVAVSVHPVTSPRGGLTILAAASGASPVIVSDDVGPLDTANARNGGASFSAPAATGIISARSGSTVATGLQHSTKPAKPLLVIGSAGWETKFVVTALEEDGWKVDASMRVAPGVSVTQGSSSAIDTSRYSAVIALDATAASRAQDIARYVAAGGGLVIAGPAAISDAFASLRASSPGRPDAPADLTSRAGAITLQSLPILPLSALRGDAIPIGRRGSLIVSAARRHVAGRVLQHGYVDTWRWRLGGGEKSADEHREWWTKLVASAAMRGTTTAEASEGKPVDDAPLARLVEALGPAASGSGPGLASRAASISLWWLFIILSLSLLTEWALRRLRGLR